MKKINIAEQSFNPFELIGKDWMLISAGTAEKWNTMTASWGGVGVMWGKPSATCYIRQSRYTKTFVDDSEFFTLTVLKDGCRDALNLLGSKLVLVCRKACKTFIGPDDMTAENVDRWYGDRDYHTMYIGEIVAAYEA